MAVSLIVALTFAAAFFYVAAAFLMKQWALMPLFVGVPSVLLMLSAAAFFEIEALRSSRLGVTFLVILAFEVMLTALAALLILGERYTHGEIAGIAIIVVGIGVLGWSQEAKAP